MNRTSHRPLLAAMLLVVAGCPSPSIQSVRELPRKLLPFSLDVVLFDGTPVAFIPLPVRCGNRTEHVITDARGRVSLQSGGACEISSRAASIKEQLHFSDPLTLLRIVLPPVHRVNLGWELANGLPLGIIELDESLSHAAPLPGLQIRIVDGALFANQYRIAGLRGLEIGQEIPVGPYVLRVKSIRPRAWLPLALRPEPGSRDFLTLPVRKRALRPIELTYLTLADINVWFIGACDDLGWKSLADLTDLVDIYRRSGLEAAVIVVDDCVTDIPSHRRDTVPVYFSGPEMVWALDSNAGELVVLDKTGKRQLRLETSRKPGAADAPEPRTAIAQAARFINKTWPLLAAGSRVSVHPSRSVDEASARRLLVQAGREYRAGRFAIALSLVEQIIKIIPGQPEARRQRARLKAILGDVTGAVSEIVWWRSVFGDESAEDLLKEIRHLLRKKQ